MNGLLTGEWGNLICIAVPILAGFVLQSTLVIGVVLVLLRVTRQYGSALQTLVIRAGLATLLCIPLVQGFMTLGGITLEIPGLEMVVQSKVSTSESTVLLSGQDDSRDQEPDIASLSDMINSVSQVQSGTGDETDAARIPISGSNSAVSDLPEPVTVQIRGDIVAGPIPQNPVTSQPDVSPSSADRSDLPFMTTEPDNPTVYRSETSEDKSVLVIILYGFLTFMWLLGMLLLIIRIGAGILYTRHLKRTARIGRTDYQHRCSRIADRLGIKPPFVYEHPKAFSTYLAGLTRPYIMVPSNDASTLLASEEVFIHELAHQKHHDIAWHIISQMLLVIYPLQPLLWLLVRKAELISDYRADDYVVVLADNNRAYARTLHDIACSLKNSRGSVHGYVPATGFFSSRSPLTARILRILDRDMKRPLTARIRDMVTLSVLLACTVVFTGFVHFEPTGRREHEPVPEVLTRPSDTFGQSDESGDKQFILQLSTMNETPEVTNQAIELSGENDPKLDNAIISDKTSLLSTDFASEPDLTIVSSNDETSTAQVLYAGADVVTAPDYTIPSEHTDTPGEGGTQIGKGSIIPATGAEYPVAISLPDTDYVEDDISAPASNTDDIADDTSLVDPGVSGPIDNTSSEYDMAMLRGSALPTVVNTTRIAMPVAKALNVVIEDYAESEYNLSNPTERKQYLLYQNLENNHNEPAWSPDGKWIAFTDFSRIWIVPACGGQPQLVYENFHTGTDYTVGGIKALSFSHDGKSLTFQKNVYDTERESRVKEYDKGVTVFSKPVVNVERINIETGAHEVLVQDAYQCMWSWTGRYLFFRTWNKLDDPSLGIWEHHGQPMLLDMQTNEMRVIELPGDGQIGIASFLPDDLALVIPCREGTITDLWQIEIDSGNRTNLTTGITSSLSYRHYDYPACSPDGNWVLFTDFAAVGENINRRLMLLSLESQEIFDLEGEIRGNASHGVWSPDGRQICFLDEEQSGSYLQVIDFYANQYPVTKPAAAEQDNAMPYEFGLVGNFPNPFNPITRIEYEIEAAGEVSIIIYNSLGQQVRRLAHDTLQAGRYSEIWDGRDDNGMDVASGMYIVRLVSGKRFATLKMTLQK